MKCYQKTVFNSCVDAYWLAYVQLKKKIITSWDGEESTDFQDVKKRGGDGNHGYELVYSSWHTYQKLKNVGNTRERERFQSS